jgi:outer membrane PBP1 activator LpoA protein
MKTTVEQIIDEFNEELKVAIEIGNSDKIRTIKHLIAIAKLHLPKEKEQSNAKIQKAIEKFEELQSKASSLKDVIYLGGVLSALEGIKNETFEQQ